MSLTPRIRQQLEEIVSFPWCERCGIDIDDLTVHRVRSAKEAQRLASLRVWESYTLQPKNYLSTIIHQRDYERAMRWNELVPQLYDPIRRLLDDVAVPHARRIGLSPTFVLKHTGWDVLLMCMEAEYQDLVSPPLFLPVLRPWYAKGHLPCGFLGPELQPGWEPPLPEGKLAVY